MTEENTDGVSLRHVTGRPPPRRIIRSRRARSDFVSRLVGIGGISLALCLVLFTACSAVETQTCPDGYEKFTEHRMFFGRGSNEAESVDDADWDKFLGEVVTPRFPDGLTVVDGAGQWREGGSVIHKERSKVLIILTPADAVVSDQLGEISEEYKSRFDHELVLITTEDACAAFN